MKVHIVLELCLRHQDKLERCGEEWQEDQKRIASAVGKVVTAEQAAKVLDTARLRSPAGDTDEERIHILLAFDCERCQWSYRVEP